MLDIKNTFNLITSKLDIVKKEFASANINSYRYENATKLYFIGILSSFIGFEICMSTLKYGTLFFLCMMVVVVVNLIIKLGTFGNLNNLDNALVLDVNNESKYSEYYIKAKLQKNIQISKLDIIYKSNDIELYRYVNQENQVSIWLKEGQNYYFVDNNRAFNMIEELTILSNEPNFWTNLLDRMIFNKVLIDSPSYFAHKVCTEKLTKIFSMHLSLQCKHELISFIQQYQSYLSKDDALLLLTLMFENNEKDIHVWMENTKQQVNLITLSQKEIESLDISIESDLLAQRIKQTSNYSQLNEKLTNILRY